MISRRPCWWFGVNNVRSKEHAHAHVTYPAIAPLLSGEIDYFTWMRGGAPGTKKHYQRMQIGDQLVFWTGDGVNKNWGIIGFGSIYDIDTHALILTSLPVRTQPITPYPSGHPTRTIHTDFLLDVFDFCYPPLRKLFFRLGYKDVQPCIVTIAEMSFSQYLRLLMRASQDVGNQLLTTVYDKQENLKKHSVEFTNAVTQSQLDSSIARRERLRTAHKQPDTVNLITIAFRRNPDVVAEVLEKANGYCQRCGKPAPFLRKTDRSPYLEVHHIQPLAENGEDTVENAIAVCPNCHRELHYGG